MGWELGICLQEKVVFVELQAGVLYRYIGELDLLEEGSGSSHKCCVGMGRLVAAVGIGKEECKWVVGGWDNIVVEVDKLGSFEGVGKWENFDLWTELMAVGTCVGGCGEKYAGGIARYLKGSLLQVDQEVVSVSESCSAVKVAHLTLAALRKLVGDCFGVEELVFGWCLGYRRWLVCCLRRWYSGLVWVGEGCEKGEYWHPTELILKVIAMLI